MTRKRFEHIAHVAFESLPELFKATVENVYIVVEDYPTEDELRSVRSSKHNLLGLYQGIPLTHRGTWYGASPTIPDTITLYQKNIEAVCDTEQEVKHRIKEVLFHELGHYFGMNERQVRQAMRNFL
jgi:predicted Zn-dependent protease with MMP-like domain